MPELLGNKRQPKAVIFSQGDEVISGTTVDTNAAYLAAICHDMGFEIIQHITVPDDMKVLIETLKNINETADMCLCTGGLGPTEDDLTTQAYADAFAVPLEYNEEAFQQMTAYFGKLNIDMPEVNRKQALLPKGTIKISNFWGTAPGFIGQANHCRFYFMPGVPYEMRNMMAATVVDDLQSHFEFNTPKLITLRIIGMGESAIQEYVNALNLATEIRISFRSGLPENELKLIFPYAFPEADMLACIERVKDTLGGVVYVVDGLQESVKSLPDYVDQLMSSKAETLCVLETFSQGEFAKQCQPAWLKQALIYPDTHAALSAFEVRAENSLNESTAEQIVDMLRSQSKASLVVLQLTEIDKDDNLILHTFLATKEGMEHKERQLSGRRERQQILAACAAFNILRKHLVG